MKENTNCPQCDALMDFVRATKQTGGYFIKEQCGACGYAELCTNVKFADLGGLAGVEKLPPYDDNACHEQRKRRDLQTFREKHGGGSPFSYEAYLHSAEWQNKRSIVFQKHGGICACCRAAAATVVHHMRYDHIGNEDLRDLLPLCRSCHEYYHPHKKVTP
jgi:hypothetical protein